MTLTGDGATQWILNKGDDLSNLGVKLDLLYTHAVGTQFKNRVEAWGGKVFHFPFEVYPREVAMREMEDMGILDYDVYHFQGMLSLYLKLVTLLREAGAKGKILFHGHNIQGPYSNEFEHSQQTELYRYKKLTSAYIGCGEDVVRAWYGRDLSDDEIVVLTNSVNLERYLVPDEEKDFIKNQLRLYHNIPETNKVIGFVGRLSQEKNVLFILELAQMSQNRQLPHTYVFIGTGPMLETLRQQVAKLDLHNCILLSQWRSDVNVQMQLLDVLLLPSQFEGVPNVVLEAQASGIPSIVTDVADEEVALDLGLVSFLPTGASERWFEQLLLILTYPPRVSIEDRREAFVKRGYDNPGSARVYLDFVERLLVT